VRDGEFEYQKVFGEDTFAAAGVIRIPPGKKKPGKPSKDNAFVGSNLGAYVLATLIEQFFFVHKGGLNVNIHRTSFNMGPGAMFMVPRGKLFDSLRRFIAYKIGNKYSIENLSQVEAELFFAQARKAVSQEEEEQIMQRNDKSRSETPSTVKMNGKKSKGRSTEPETEAESTPASKKKKKIGKK
jgi:centromere protein C